MKKLLDKISKNDFLRFTFKFIKVVLYVLIICIMAIILVQRFSNNKVSVAGLKVYTILTGSMIPKYKISDMILVKEVEPDKVKLQDDLVYIGDEGDFTGKTVVHQVINVKKANGRYVFTTRGIANTADDPEVDQDQIEGVVIYKPVILSFISRILNNIFGFYFGVLVPVCVLIFIEIIQSIKDKKDKKDDEIEVI
ncbi:MAG TPA: signal peptidase I [Bacilli bacterium]|nr:signal peptidase I [Bacilli bacterium]